MKDPQYFASNDLIIIFLKVLKTSKYRNLYIYKLLYTCMLIHICTMPSIFVYSMVEKKIRCATTHISAQLIRFYFNGGHIIITN